jgi:hypothetical protein
MKIKKKDVTANVNINKKDTHTSAKNKDAEANANTSTKKKDANADTSTSTKKKDTNLITNREFKILLKPEGLDRRSRINQFMSLFTDFCAHNKVDFMYLNNASTSLRNVFFFDTPGEDLRRNNLILRVRELRQNAWVDDWCELTLKCRAGTHKESLAYDPMPETFHNVRRRIKEEILRGDKVGTTRLIYSNNSIIDAMPVDSIFERDFGSVSKFFPDLKKLNIGPKVPVRIVGGRTNKILEACLPMGNLVFGDNVQAHCDIAIWMRSVGDPIVGEFAFSYRVNEGNREDEKAHRRADKFFKQLQLTLNDWIQIGSTKTALVYGKPE